MATSSIGSRLPVIYASQTTETNDISHISNKTKRFYLHGRFNTHGVSFKIKKDLRAILDKSTRTGRYREGKFTKAFLEVNGERTIVYINNSSLKKNLGYSRFSDLVNDSKEYEERNTALLKADMEKLCISAPNPDLYSYYPDHSRFDQPSPVSPTPAGSSGGLSAQAPSPTPGAGAGAGAGAGGSSVKPTVKHNEEILNHKLDNDNLLLRCAELRGESKRLDGPTGQAIDSGEIPLLKTFEGYDPSSVGLHNFREGAGVAKPRPRLNTGLIEDHIK